MDLIGIRIRHYTNFTDTYNMRRGKSLNIISLIEAESASRRRVTGLFREKLISLGIPRDEHDIIQVE